MISWILNEYVHVDEAELTDLGWWVDYEPLEHESQSFSLSGYIYIRDHPVATIVCGRSPTRLLTSGWDDVQCAGFENNSIRLLWKECPGEHYLCISYQVGNTYIEPIPSWNWKEEGF